MKNLPIIVLALALTGCMTYKAPYIIDIGSKKITVKKDLMAAAFSQNSATDEDVKKVAQVGCKNLHEGATAVGLSQFQQPVSGLDGGGTIYIFACKR